MATWKILYCGDKEEKGTRTTTPKPCRRNTACAAQQSGEAPQEGWSPGTTALRPCRGGPGCHSQPPPPGGSGQTSLGYSHTGKRSTRLERQNHVASRSAKGYTTNLSREQTILSQVGSRMWHKGLSCPAMRVGQAHCPGLFCSLPLQAHTGQPDGRTWSSLRSVEGKDVLKVT